MRGKRSVQGVTVFVEQIPDPAGRQGAGGELGVPGEKVRRCLLGLLEEGTGTAARVLAENGANEQEIRDMIRDLIAPVSPVPVKERDGYSPRAMAILEESHRQAARFRWEPGF